ncbi:unnamed protein product [Arabis nemorensis]|uniref:Uncharacterized protein n=1 Tax=Arabis nemorensis TaxID=586526 RepID=A0A565AS35_9BRAS|nr:unnamed protein product [Arabis nemorensis]
MAITSSSTADITLVNLPATVAEAIPSIPVPLTWCQRFKIGSSTLEKCRTPYELNKVIEESKPMWKDFVIGQLYRKSPSFGKI